MALQETLGKIHELVDNPYKYVAEYKDRYKKKVIALLPMHIPEELVHAAGMIPVMLWRGNEPISLGLAYSPTYHCGFSRSLVDDAVKGKFSFLDGIIFYDTCLVARGVTYSLRKQLSLPFLKLVYLPLGAGSIASRDHLIENLTALKTSLEEFSGQKISKSALRKSISIYNENRALLARLYDFRRRNPGVLKTKDVVAIVNSSMLMPKEEHNELMRGLLGELERKRAGAKKGVRVILAGHFCYVPRFDILDVIDEAGGLVVDDDLFCGYRYFATQVDETKEPIEALADRILARTVPDPTKIDVEACWGGFLKEMVIKNKASGVISLLVQFCPPHQAEHPDYKHILNEAEIPELLIQEEYEMLSLSGYRTRIETFIESLE